MTSIPQDTPASPWRWWVCGLLFLATTLNYMDRVGLNQMAVRIQDALHLDDIEYSRLESGFSFAFAVGAVAFGFLVDRVNVRWVYPAAVLGWSAAGVLTGYASGFAWLIVCRIALGFFEAGNWPCGIRTTKAVLRPDERSFGNSLF
ncbi:MAG TPA: MFS transporter, partial [Urbifossiella sp.]|nr:MFS transporter [Urbifossiella sp.]